jgi:hypothetical protein
VRVLTWELALFAPLVVFLPWPRRRAAANAVTPP